MPLGKPAKASALGYTLTSSTQPPSPTPCSSVTESTAPTSSSAAGTTVTFTGSASGCPNPLYQFWILAPGSSSWTVLQAYTLTPTPCTSVTESAVPTSPSSAGTAVTFTASASGCPNPLYQFWILAPGSTTWTVARAYSTNATFHWNTGGPLSGGAYSYTVWVRDASSAGTQYNNLGRFDANLPSAPAYTLTTVPCSSVTESAAPPNNAASGTTVSFTASASGCPNPLYQFWILAPGSTTWTIGQAYSSAATFNWNTTGLLAGNYTYTVWARDVTSGGTQYNNLGRFDANFPTTAYTLTAVPCTAVTESAAPASPSPSGTTVTFSASASGCPHPLYQFWILAPGSTTWTIVQAYSSTSTFNWITTGLVAGTYKYTVWARDASSAGTNCNTGGLGCNDANLPAPLAYTLSS